MQQTKAFGVVPTAGAGGGQYGRRQCPLPTALQVASATAPLHCALLVAARGSMQSMQFCLIMYSQCFKYVSTWVKVSVSAVILISYFYPSKEDRKILKNSESSRYVTKKIMDVGFACLTNEREISVKKRWLATLFLPSTIEGRHPTRGTAILRNQRSHTQLESFTSFCS